MDEDLQQIRALPCWQGEEVTAQPLLGGITNINYLVESAAGKYVVRLGQDIPVHHVMRFNEYEASRAAARAGISPEVVHSQPGALVLRYIEAETLDAEQVAAKLPEVIALVRRCHREMPDHFRGPALAFWVFHVIRDYAAALKAAEYKTDVEALLDKAESLEAATGMIDMVFGHNDLLPANLLDDGERLWLIDWDYAGYNSPLFDLGGLASNNTFTEAQERQMLEFYFEQPVDGALFRKYRAMKAASLLRETMWSMVSEIHSSVDFDYESYTRLNLERFNQAWADFRQV